MRRRIKHSIFFFFFYNFNAFLKIVRIVFFFSPFFFFPFFFSPCFSFSFFLNFFFLDMQVRKSRKKGEILSTLLHARREWKTQEYWSKWREFRDLDTGLDVPAEDLKQYEEALENGTVAEGQQSYVHFFFPAL